MVWCNMIPKRLDHVKLIFVNGMVEEGIVLEWSDENSAIRSLQNQNVLIIQNTKQNIIAIKINMEQSEKKPNVSTKQPVYVDNTEELDNVHIRDPQLRYKKLAELQALKRAEEAKRVRAHLNTFEVGEVAPPRYTPPFIPGNK